MPSALDAPPPGVPAARRATFTPRPPEMYAFRAQIYAFSRADNAPRAAGFVVFCFIRQRCSAPRAFFFSPPPLRVTDADIIFFDIIFRLHY